MTDALFSNLGPFSEARRAVLKKVYSVGKWVVQWDHTIVVSEQRMVYIVLGASHGRVFVISLYHEPGDTLAFEGLYQLPLNWHGEHAKDFKSARGEKLIGEREAIKLECARLARECHIVGELNHAYEGRHINGAWYFPPAGHYWRWRTNYDGPRTNPLGRALQCAFQHPRVSHKPRVKCLHCEYPRGRRAEEEP